VGNGKPVKHFLLFLGSDAVVLVEKVKELGFRFFQRSVCSGFEVSEIREDAFFELLGVGDGSTECEEAVSEGANNVCASNVKEVVPEVSLLHKETYHKTQETYSPDGS
jgi:hypothetical protein